MTTKDGLVFYEASHRYKLDGKWIPGVTTLLGKGLPKPALVYWSAKSVAEFVADRESDVEQLRTMGRGPMIAALKQVPWQSRDDAAVRGTDVHHIAEKLIHGEEVEVPDHLDGAVNGYIEWVEAWQPEVIWTERPVASREHWYAGKPDIVCRIRGDVWLLDWKTSRAVYGDNALQVRAYGGCEFSLTDEGAEEPMPVIERYGVVHIDHGETYLYEVIDPDSAWTDWLNVLAVAKAEQRIKGYLGEPLDAPDAAA